MRDTKEEGIRPTKETKAKAVEGVIGQLQRRKVNGRPFLIPEHVQAAHDIETAYRLITKPLEHALSDPDRIGREPSPPEGDFSPAEKRLYDAYNRWVDMLDNCSQSLYGLTIDICVEGRRLRETERRYDLDSGDGKHRLRDSLATYCRVNGRVI